MVRGLRYIGEYKLKTIKSKLCDIEKITNFMIGKEIGEGMFYCKYKWNKGKGGKYFSAVFETSKGYFCVLYLVEKNIFTLSKNNDWSCYAIKFRI